MRTTGCPDQRGNRGRRAVLTMGASLALFAAGCSGEPSRLAEVSLPALAQAPSAAHPTLALVPRSHGLLLAWLAGEGPERRAWFARSADAGASWSAPLAVSPPGERLDADEGSAPKLACDAEGRVALAWVSAGADTGARVLRFARSLDGGRTWSAPVTPDGDTTGPASASHLDLVSSDGGRLVLAWLEQGPGGGEAGADTSAGSSAVVRMIRSSDFGGRWDAGAAPRAWGCPRCRVAVGLDLIGSAFVAFRRHEPGDVRDVVLARPEGPPVRAFADRWSAPECPESGPSLTVARDGTLRVAWYTGVPGRTGVWFRQGIPETYDSTLTPLAVLAADGLPPVHVATGDAGRQGTLIALDADSTGAGGLTLARVEASGRRLLERIAAPGVRGASRPRLAASNMSRRAFVAWTERMGDATRVRMLRWDVGR